MTTAPTTPKITIKIMNFTYAPQHPHSFNASSLPHYAFFGMTLQLRDDEMFLY